MRLWGQVEVDPRLGTIVAVGGGIAFALCGLLIVSYLIYVRREASRSADWPTTDGEIISSNVSDIPGKHVHIVHVRYRYWVGGKKYVSNRVTAAQFGYGSREEAQAVADHYPAGEGVTVYYDPKKPQRAVLQRGTKSTGYFEAALVLIGALAVLVGLYFLLFVR